ncbi:MAG: hypothetical protein GX567_07290, partial [Clostridia bacterium]|nr:hypothetical protein [Clostridia bacterium]
MSDQKWKHIHNKIVPMVCVVALLLAEPVNAMSNVISISTNDIHSGVIIENGISENGINENEM